ncbi:hypothetical protein [Undibacterium rugosum]|uniref:Uncharacterized protein n=1 Tax=Undibacterium rugosum TaxID=2762291 RepID=A0A923KS83_9BURK|nr:hypothetical protein [Undibacterium rugosum]MBC3934654.1 hypothetical protein [Undibacterium rugosum]MBR7779796.1 hypothetical protein [Undibacterium rugosum]
MKKLIFALFMSIVMTPTLAQQDYMEAIANRSCTCIEKIPRKGINKEALTMQLGVCIMQSVTPADREKILADYKVDLFDIERKGQEKAGAIIGTRMAAACPGPITTLYSMIKDTVTDISGTVQKIETEGYVSLIIKDTQGKTHKVVWLSPTKGNLDLPAQYTGMTGKMVTARCEVKEIFDPRIGEYRPMKIITEISEGFIKPSAN